MNKGLRDKKRVLVQQSDTLRDDLERECASLSEGYRLVVQGIAGAAALIRAVRLVRRGAALPPFRFLRKEADDRGTDQ